MEHGSPLTVEGDGRNIVTGVSSWTLGCGGDGRQYAVYSELAKVDFQTEFKVYNRDGQSCYDCKNLIIKIKQAGRSSFYCKQCQK